MHAAGGQRYPDLIRGPGPREVGLDLPHEVADSLACGSASGVKGVNPYRFSAATRARGWPPFWAM
jgi:hypothetical protein